MSLVHSNTSLAKHNEIFLNHYQQINVFSRKLKAIRERDESVL